MGEWDIPKTMGDAIIGRTAPLQPKIMDTGHAPVKFAIDWERRVVMMGVVVKDEMGFHAGGFDLTPADCKSLGELMIKLAIDCEDGGGQQPR